MTSKDTGTEHSVVRCGVSKGDSEWLVKSPGEKSPGFCRDRSAAFLGRC